MAPARAWRRMWLWSLPLVLLACGDDPLEQPGPPAPPARGGAILEAPPSLLDLIDGRGDHGTFTISIAGEVPGGGELRYTGRYVRTADGGTYTIVDMDVALVRAEVAELLALHERFDTLDPIFADAVLTADTVVTDHLQLGLADVVLRYGGLGPAGLLVAEPSLVFTAMEDGDPDACTAAISALDAAVHDRIDAERSNLGRRWQLDAEALGGPELDEAHRSCDGLGDPLGWEVAVEVGDARFAVLIGGEEALVVEVHPGDGEPMAVDAATATPAPMLDRFGRYFLSIDRCGGLPWLYTNFAAANSYSSPEEGGYIGPTPFKYLGVCADDVPVHERSP